MSSQKTNSISVICTFSILFSCCYFFASDLYLPSLVDIRHAFSASTGAVQFSLSGFLFAIGLSQLIYGPLSDKHGRKPILFISLIIMILGTLVSVFAPNIIIFDLGRIIQGIGAGGMVANVNTIARDVMTTEQFIKIWPWVALSFSILPSIAPAIGGYLQSIDGWITCFIFLLIFQVLLMLSLSLLKETHHNKNPKAVHLSFMFHNYRKMLGNKKFMLYTYGSAKGFSGLIYFYTVGTFIYIHDYGYSPIEFGWLSFSIIIFVLAGRLVNGMFTSKRYSQDLNILIFTVVCLVGSIIIFAGEFLPDYAPIVIIVGMMILSFGGGVTNPNNTTQALNVFTENKGASSALYGCMYLAAPGIAGVISIILPNTIMYLGLFLIVTNILAIWAISAIMKHKKAE